MIKLIVKKTISVSVLLAAAVCVFAQDNKTFSVDEVVPSVCLEELKEKRIVSFSHTADDKEMKLLPVSSYSQKAKENFVEKDDGNLGFVTENLYLVSKKTLEENTKNSDGKADTSMDSVARVLRSVSKMQGMQYYSRSDKKWETLYDKAYMIDNDKDRNPIADANTGDADGQEGYCYQHDNSFGDCYYKLNYYATGNEMYATFNNFDWMYFGIIKAVKPGQLMINIIVMDCGEDYLVYISTDADCLRFGPLVKKINNSFAARIEAIYNWFITQF